MTALTQYQRLESPGIWHQDPDSQRRDIYVSLGDSTLVIKDQADMALTHWSLPAVVRIGPGNDPAIFAPGPEDDERLELTDQTMIDALDQVRRALMRGDPQRGRLRLLILSALVAAIVALTVFWLPGALVNHTARALPEATRQEIGRRLVNALTPYTGQTCRARTGQTALDTLQNRLFGQAPWDLRITETGHGVIALPGGILLAGNDLLQGQDSPDAIAGHLLAGATRSLETDPMHWMLSQAGTRDTFRMLTTGKVSDAVLATAAKGLALGQNLPPVDPTVILNRFRDANVSSRAFGLTANGDGEVWIDMIEGNPYPAGTPDSLMSDAAWLRLQSICDRP